MSRRHVKQQKLAKARQILFGVKPEKIVQHEQKNRGYRHSKSYMFGRGIAILGVVTLVWLYHLIT